MRDATAELEKMLEFCKQILDAETTQEVDALKEEIPNLLREQGYSEEGIEYFMLELTTILELIEKEEIIIDATGQLALGPNAPQEMLETGSLQKTPENVKKDIIGFGIPAIGISLSLILACITIKKQIYKKNKEKDSLHK